MTVETKDIGQIAAPREKSETWSQLFQSAAFAKIFVGIIILVAWQVSADLFAADFVARPTGILEVMPGMIAPEWYYTTVLGQAEAPFDVVARHNVFFASVGNTLLALVIGLTIALVIGTIVGVLMGRVKVVDRLLFLYVVGFYAMPNQTSQGLAR